jgi:PAS domain S-box-containing protein
VNTFPIFQKSNLSFEGIVVQFSDITSEKSKSETADQSTQKLSLALGLTGSGVWEYDLENNRFWWSKEHHQLFGLSDSLEPSESNFLASILSDDRPVFTKALYHSIQTRSDLDQQFRIEHPQQGIRWIHCKGLFHFDHVAETHKLIAIETDVTDQLEQEKRIAKAERTLNDLIKVVPVGIFKTNLEGLCNFLNDQGEKIIGVAKIDAEGFGWTKNLDEKDRIRFFSRWQQLISGVDEHEVIEDNLAFSTEEGSRQVMVHLKVERDLVGQPIGFVGTLTDVSQIIQNEKKIKRLNEILVTQYNKLRKYAHINSHDLRGPLTTIMSILNVLRSGDTKLDREYLDALLKSSDKMDSVIKELNELLKDVEFEDVVGENYEVTQSLNVMLIDDDPFQNLINSKVVSNQNSNIVVHDFNEAHRALELLINKTMEPDFILLDLSMPIMNGWEFLEEMERNQLDIQVHILTSSINPNDFVRAKSFKNVKGFLSKPLKAELVDAILSRYIPLR